MQLTNEWYYFISAIDKKVCKKIIALGADEFKEATVNVGKGITEEERIKGKPFIGGTDSAVRSSDVKWITEQWVYDLIWPYMQTANDLAGWKFDIKSAESGQVTRYKPRGFYSWHRDGKSDHLSKYDMPKNKFKHDYVRKLSMTVLLNEDYQGGDFQFACSNKGKVNIETPTFNKAGSIIVFPSFMEHRVAPVTKGTRYSLVTWFLGPPFV